MQENKNLFELVQELKKIEFHHSDLLEVVLLFSDKYIKNNKEKELQLGKFLSNSKFIDQAILATQESVLLGVNCISLKQDIDFKELIKEFVDIELQRKNENLICKEETERKIYKEFMNELRKENFSQIFSRNKNFNLVSKLSKNILNQRYEIFMKEKFL